MYMKSVWILQRNKMNITLFEISSFMKCIKRELMQTRRANELEKGRWNTVSNMEWNA